MGVQVGAGLLIFKIVQEFVLKTNLPIVMQAFIFPCQVFPDKTLQK